MPKPFINEFASLEAADDWAREVASTYEFCVRVNGLTYIWAPVPMARDQYGPGDWKFLGYSFRMKPQTREAKVQQPNNNSNIQVEITDASEFHCFRLVLNPQSTESDPNPRIEIMLHARSLIDLIHKCSLALADWQFETTNHLLHLTRGE